MAFGSGLDLGVGVRNVAVMVTFQGLGLLEEGVRGVRHLCIVGLDGEESWGGVGVRLASASSDWTARERWGDVGVRLASVSSDWTARERWGDVGVRLAVDVARFGWMGKPAWLASRYCDVVGEGWATCRFFKTTAPSSRLLPVMYFHKVDGTR